MKFIILLFICFSLTAQNKNNFIIRGNCTNCPNKYLFINYENKKDSCLVKDNKFILNGSISKSISIASFSYSNMPCAMKNDFYIENTEIYINLNVEEKVLKDFKINIFDVTKQKGGLTAEIQSDFYNFEINHKDDKDWKFKLYNKVDLIATKYPKNIFLGDILSKLSWDKTLDKEKLKLIYKKIDQKSQDENSLKIINQNLYPEKFININDAVFDFELPDQDDKLFNTKNLNGKYYLIDFWASWCSPCRKSFPDLSNLYKKYNHGFEVITISIDKDIEKWKIILKKENINFINLIENKGFFGEITKKYKVNFIPSNFLINPEGKIVAKNISNDDLDSFLIKNLK